MACHEAPLHLIVTIQDGLIDDDMSLGTAVIVEVAEHRRNTEGWPALMVGALVMAPDMPEGVPAVWATGEDGQILAVDHAAREYSSWEPAARADGQRRDTFAGFPEAEEARRCLPDFD
jgi:PAS domain-containing protein